jgi:hypothetical protein
VANHAIDGRRVEEIEGIFEEPASLDLLSSMVSVSSNFAVPPSSETPRRDADGASRAAFAGGTSPGRAESG